MSSLPVEPVSVWECFSSPAVPGLREKEPAFRVRSYAEGSGLSASAPLARFSGCRCPERCAGLQALIFFNPFTILLYPLDSAIVSFTLIHRLFVTHTSGEFCSPCKHSGWSRTCRTTFCIFKNATGSEFANKCQDWLSGSEGRAASRVLALSPSSCATVQHFSVTRGDLPFWGYMWMFWNV